MPSARRQSRCSSSSGNTTAGAWTRSSWRRQRDLRGGRDPHPKRRPGEGDGADALAVCSRHGAYRIVGILLGIVMAQCDMLEYVLDPFINALYAIPRIALVPLIILWAGLEFAGKVTILVSVAIFPSPSTPMPAFATCAAPCWISAAPMARPNGRSSGRSSLPACGARSSGGRAACRWACQSSRIIVAEFFTCDHGLGRMIVILCQRVRDRQAVRAHHRDRAHRRHPHRAGDVAGAAHVALAHASKRERF